MTNAVFDLPEILTSLNTVSVFARLALAVAFGGILGLERGRKHRPAGFRTYMIVCLSSALVMITDLYLVEFYGTGDPARLGAQVISGIGFLGAGSIMISNMRIKGITTAAGLWGSAGLGLALGAGFYIGAFITGVFLLIIMTIMSRIDARMNAMSRSMIIFAEFKSTEALSSFVKEARKMNCTLSDIEMKKSLLDGDYIGVNIAISLPKRRNHAEVIQQFGALKGVKYIEEL
ncbi:MgtC/SapB family protein [Treponema socranskii]|uniref:Mg2+ transporter-C, MgtC family n=1 Tax=Treponema socranskii subsp. socranskii VPI DR56BR1116 = ATCC 35536 TaxID=1125725 RepID=U2MZS9_TRESO|nr:MgtC/SapB family protein [Treponema socranskii]ERF61226.1 Mg2+ transporter-C, MgtC family [Treponema socranskii subsp. socranskii VPI DR56BR1116 = ATCC 35536]ERK04704.1 Mg2+ transporter-C, MgtC family [Treponema socranskii subsp. socranskii VPI DR56BR1116 = ATCC 35536]MDR9859542.1 MgtC/SapB family protein [Treponema socranskii]